MSISTPKTDTAISFRDSELQRKKRKRYRLNHQQNTCVKVEASSAFPAEELRCRLDPKFPSFVKYLLKSHVTGGFWMGLPAPFSRKHLPEKDAFITLETQSKKLYRAKYLVKKIGLSSGWRDFAISEKLLVGDALVFQLLSTTKFKVHIIKGNNSAEVERARYTLNLDSPEKQNMLVMSNKGKDCPEDDQKTMQSLDEPENDITSEDSIGATHCLQICKSEAPSYNTVSTYDDFNNEINDLLKDFELPQHIKLSYYKLCCSQNELLHVHLPKLMNNIFVGGTIIAIVTIANSLKECELSTSKDEFAVWDKTLNALGILGMNIGFLRARLLSLQKIVQEPEVPTLRKKCTELCSKNARAKYFIRSLATRLAKLKKVQDKRAADISNLKSKLENHELKFREQVQAPW